MSFNKDTSKKPESTYNFDKSQFNFNPYSIPYTPYSIPNQYPHNPNAYMHPPTGTFPKPNQTKPTQSKPERRKFKVVCNDGEELDLESHHKKNAELAPAPESVPVEQAPTNDVPEEEVKETPAPETNESPITQVLSIIKYSLDELKNFKPIEHNKITSYNAINVVNPENPVKGSNFNKNNSSKNNSGTWAREQQPQRKSKQAATGPMPKKVVTDPLELLTHELTSILNKITPQTFDKLLGSIMELKVKNTDYLSKLVDVIYEKAVREPSFSSIYSQLCYQLKEHWNFIYISNFNGKYFWFINPTFSNEFLGPFVTLADAETEMEINKPEDYPHKQIINDFKQEDCSILLIGNYFFRLLKKDGQYYFSYLKNDAIPTKDRSIELYDTEKEAFKEGKNHYSFRGMLAHICEREFKASVDKNNSLEAIDKELAELRANPSNYTNEEYLNIESELEEKRGKIKGRMLGNIRFVGELYKNKLLNTTTMHDCVENILGPIDVWKPKYEDQDLEILCKLFTSLGESFEAKNVKSSKNNENKQKFEAYFKKIESLSKDRTINSRIRFSLEEVVALRANGWKSRREQDVPVKIDELHSKIKNEEKNESGSSKSREKSRKDRDEKPSRKDRDRERSKKDRSDRDKEKDRSEKEEKKSKKSSSSSNNSPKPAPEQESTTPKEYVPVAVDFTQDALIRNANNTIDEYLSNKSLDDLILCLTENNLFHRIAFFIKCSYVKLFDAKVTDRPSILDMLANEKVIELLKKYPYYVKSGIEKTIFSLYDWSMDDSNIADLVSKSLKVFISANIIDKAYIADVSNEAIKLFIEDYDEAELREYFDEFLSKI